MHKPSKLIDEILEQLWKLREVGSKSISRVIDAVNNKDTHNAMKKMERAGLVTIKDDTIELDKRGEDRARDLIRRHRLAERLFYDVFEVGYNETEDTACEIEHILSPSVTDSVCSFLGHPPTCPHGKPIPRGECCLKYRSEYKPLVIPLKELDVGSSARIVFIVPSESSRIERLASMGIVPGSIIRLKKKRPSFVLEIEETTLAIDDRIAEEIYVRMA
ncbi:MAG: metal-dependent transcriptional regulator [Thermodesulfovibrionia bacterium]